MDIEQLYAVLGRKQAELDAMHGEYNRLLAMLGNIADGHVLSSWVKVDLVARTWTVTPVPPVLEAAPPLTLVGQPA